MVRYLTVPIGALIVGLWMSTAAFAHSKMTTSNPTDGSTVKPGLEQVELTFKQAVRLVRVTITRDDGSAAVPLTGKPDAAHAQAHEVKFATLQAGAYWVEWTALAKDGHIMKGKFSFSVRP